MEILPFKPSADFSMGIELEFQIIHPASFNLLSKAKDLVRNVQPTPFANLIKPEITQSMLEINSSVQQSTSVLLTELEQICAFLNQQAEQLNLNFCGGGTHPFQKWVSRKIFPIQRYRNIAKRYKYIAKRSTVFGLHIHIGCSNTEHAIYLCHLLARYVHQLLAISASSPFYEGIDTGYNSTRSTIFNSYPLCGTIPYVTDWRKFSSYFHKMKGLGVIDSMKDFYWDIRPKPEFGTIEIRVCDAPLTVKKAALIAAFVQSLSYYLLHERPFPIAPDLYTFHSYNKFQGARYGLEGSFIDPYSLERRSIHEDILSTLVAIQPAADYLGNGEFLAELKADIMDKRNDAATLRALFDETRSLKEVVREQCRLFKEQLRINIK